MSTNINQLGGNGLWDRGRIPQLYGVEIEVEHCLDPPVWCGETQWSWVEDGSLRNNGMEFITPPVIIEELGDMVQEYYRHHDREGYQASLRTGIHVHADMRWRTVEQVTAICTLYSILEPALFELCGPEREECIYCVPWYRAPDEVEVLNQVRMYADERDDWRTAHSHLGGACKYSALYLEPLRRLGTIEFRAAPTFDRAADLMRWVHTLRRLVALGHYLGTPERVVDYYEGHPYRVLSTVLGDETDVMDAATLIELEDSAGVAAGLVRTKQKFEWKHIIEEPLERTGVYYNARRGRVTIERPVFTEMDEEWDEPGWGHEDDEEGDF